jgi:predicted HAD superfamily Cof-like phosphohydrolase
MFKEPNAINDVTEFHKLTGNSIEHFPTIPKAERCALRASLIGEELRELVLAMEQDDIVEAADALCDIQYVLSGSIVELGLSECFAELFAEVHRSNMSKACKSMQEVEETMIWYRDQGWKYDDLGYKSMAHDQYFVIDKSNNDKTLKSVNYSPADLKPILERAKTVKI